MTGMETFYGHVNTLEQFFSYGPDGKLAFSPFNTNYGTVHPDREPGTGKNAVEFTLEDGEFFQVREDIDKSEGRGGTNPAGNFLDYPAAYRHAHGRGAQGSIAAIVIMTPAGTENVTALQVDGTTVIMAHNTKWQATSLQRRLHFPNRPATKPEDGAGSD